MAIGWHVIQYGNKMNDWIDCFVSLMCKIDPETGQLYTAKAAFDITNDTVTGLNVEKAVLFGTDPNFRFQ